MLSEVQQLFEDYCMKKRESLAPEKAESSSNSKICLPEDSSPLSLIVPQYPHYANFIRRKKEEPKEQIEEKDDGSKCNRKRRINREQFISHYFTSGCKSKRIKTSSDAESPSASHTVPEECSNSPSFSNSRVVLFEHLDDLCVICCDTFSDDVTNLTLSPCNHTYHKTCILRWKVENNSCPMCRTQMKTSIESQDSSSTALDTTS